MASPLLSSKSALPLLMPLLCFGLLLFFFFQPTSMPDLSFFRPHSTISQTNCELYNLLTDRGAWLSHSWTDEELFHRAVLADLKNPQLADPPSPELADPPSQTSYMSHIQALTHSYFFKSSKESPPLASQAENLHRMSRCGRSLTLESKATPKIAFLFLTTDALPFAPLWAEFFKGNEHLYNIYVHLYPFRVGLFDKSSGVFWGRLVPSDKTERGTASLIAAGRRLLANALLDDPLNKYFALISDHCIPLHGFRTVYKQVTGSDKSFLQIMDYTPFLHSRYVAWGADSMLPEIPFSKFRIGSQFFVLIRKHALLAVSDKRYWKKFDKPCPDPSSCFAEEHYFPTLVDIEDPEGSTGHTLTYVNWSESHEGHPKSYRKDEISKQLIESLQQQENGRFLFARKFDDDCLDALLELAPLILRH